MSGPSPRMGEPEAPTTFTQARARMPRGQLPLSICTCWMESCGPAARATEGRRARASANVFTGCMCTMSFPAPRNWQRGRIRPRLAALRFPTLFPLLPDRAAFELELDVPQLDDVVVDQVVLL